MNSPASSVALVFVQFNDEVDFRGAAYRSNEVHHGVVHLLSPRRRENSPSAPGVSVIIRPLEVGES